MLGSGDEVFASAVYFASVDESRRGEAYASPDDSQQFAKRATVFPCYYEQGAIAGRGFVGTEELGRMKRVCAR